MDKEFWADLSKNDYQIPEGHALEELTKTLFSYLGSTDPDSRDEIAYVVYANWLKRDMFSLGEIENHINELLANLEKGVGETESDSVFLRAFSVLLLAEIVHNDNKKSLLEKEQIQRILERGLWYLEAENDPRGYIPVKGWAHALAHTADLMLVLGRNRYLEGNDLTRILQGIANKIKQQNNYVYIHREDERLANAVAEILQRGVLDLEYVESWAGGFLQPEKFTFDGTFKEDISRLYQNTRNLLRSVHIQVFSRAEIRNKENLQMLLLKALQSLQQF
ncbi:MAG TPA: DUF2785 domain-containing protein [Anaerolineales bacterium]|nr:DUF2785 domain-containing protein [Anaerolineales bacterium]